MNHRRLPVDNAKTIDLFYSKFTPETFRIHNSKFKITKHLNIYTRTPHATSLQRDFSKSLHDSTFNPKLYLGILITNICDYPLYRRKILRLYRFNLQLYPTPGTNALNFQLYAISHFHFGICFTFITQNKNNNLWQNTNAYC